MCNMKRLSGIGCRGGVMGLGSTFHSKLPRTENTESTENCCCWSSLQQPRESKKVNSLQITRVIYNRILRFWIHQGIPLVVRENSNNNKSTFPNDLYFLSP